MNLAELLELYDRDLKPGDISGQEFQNAVFIRMFRKLNLSGMELCNFPEGEVDFAIAKPDFDYITKKPTFEQWHLFECKNHNRSIEFATAAKLMLIGLRWQVHSINLVSRTTLQRQARDYAKTFFRLDEEFNENRVPYPEQRKIGGAGLTIFRHFITRDLVGFELAPIVDNESPGNFAAARPTLTWTLVELQAFSERVCAVSSDGATRVRVKANRFYRLESTIDWWTDLKDPAFGIIETGLGNITLCRKATVEVDAPERLARLSILFRIAAEYIGSELTLPGLALSARDNFRWMYAPPVILDVVGDATMAPNMRPTEQVKFNDLFSDPANVHLIMLTGEAGTGKSWLCDRVAEERRAYSASDVLRFDAMVNASDGDLIQHIAVNIMMPARLRVDDELEALTRSIVDTLSGRATDTLGAAPRATPVPLAEFVAKSIVDSDPRILIVRNCERLSYVAAREVRDLVRAIERRGWGDVHIVLEGRDDERDDEGWQWLRSELLSISGVKTFPLKPMDRSAVDEWLRQAFESISTELMDICWRRAGGYPLILQSLLECWRDRGAIEWSGSRWRIIRPTILREQVRSLGATSAPADKSEQVLVERLRGAVLPDVKLASPFDDAQFVLGLFALAETPDRMSLLTEMLNLGNAMSILTTALRGTGLLDSPKHELRFRHDRLREASITIASMASDDRKDALLRCLPAGDVLQLPSLELLGDLQLFAGEADRAWAQYQVACDQAIASEAFLDACRIAAKQQELHQRYDSLLTRPHIDYLRVIEARAWAEWNCGSLIAARELYQHLVEEATKAADHTVDSTIARVVVSHAAGRLVGIDLDLADVDSFIRSAATALSGYQDAGDFNAVMNRLVLACGQYGLPTIGKLFASLSLTFVTLRQGEDRWQAELESVAAGVVGCLYFDTMPQAATHILREAVRWSRGPRQRLTAEIDALGAEFLATTILDVDRTRALRADAVRHGFYAFLAQIDILRSADALRQNDIREARRLLGEAETRIAVQGQSCYSVALANNALICALSLKDAPLSRRWSLALARLVDDQLEGREKLIKPLSESLHRLAIVRADQLRRRYPDATPLALDVPKTLPLFCGSLFIAWFNLRRLVQHNSSELREVIELIRPVAHRNITALDVAASESEFDNVLGSRAVECGGTPLAFCLE